MSTEINQLMERIKAMQIKEGSGHDWWHTLRVYNNAKLILKTINSQCNAQIVEIAAILHDVADHKFGYTDADRTRIVADLFAEFNLNFELLDAVTTIVNDISFSKNRELFTLEGKIVQDADRLDAIGSIGIARAFTYGGYNKRAIHIPINERQDNDSDTLDHFEEKLFKVAERMNTEVGKEIARKRTVRMQEFIDNFHDEWDGLS